VMVREIDGLVLFRNDQDRENFISRMSHLVESTGTKILAWALMNNHVHLLGEADKHLSRQLRLGERVGLVTRVIKRVCDEAGIKEEELRNGGRRRKVSHARARISFQLSRELGIPAAEIARHLGVCTSAIAKAIQKLES
jgi:REP element-mobilizing transposase RayT